MDDEVNFFLLYYLVGDIDNPYLPTKIVEIQSLVLMLEFFDKGRSVIIVKYDISYQFLR